MPGSELDGLRKRLKLEEDHLEWFTSTGQTMDSSGSSGTLDYVASTKAAIADLKRRIAEIEQNLGS